MDAYKPLLDSSEELSPYRDEETKALSPGIYTSSSSFPPQKRASLLLRLVFAICLLLTISLAGANAWASHRLSVSLADALPAPDVMKLGRADQYDGLSDNSRHKLYYHEDLSESTI